MPDRAEIWLADLLRAVRALDADPSEWPAIARLLGLELPALAASPDDVSVTEPPQAAPAPVELPDDAELSRGSAASSPSAAARRRPTDEARPRPSRLLRVERQGDPSPSWLHAVPIPPTAPDEGARARPDPLLRGRWAPSVLAALLSTAAAATEIDVDRVIADLAAGRPVHDVPYRIRPTLARGAQVLLDVGHGMAPFAHDQAHVVAAVRDVLGGAPLEVLRFAGCPLRGAGAGRRTTWQAYAPPERGRPVLALTDLGLARPSGDLDRPLPAEWLAFDRLLDHADCPLVALVPYPTARVPPSLRRAFAIVPWDVDTSVGVVRRELGGVLEVR